MKHMVKFTALVCCSLAAASLFADPATGWKQTAGGTYDYNDKANWVDENVNGIFGSDLTLAGAQTITFASNTTLNAGLTINYKGNYPMTFQSDGSGAKTLTLGGDVKVNVANNGKAAHVTIGCAEDTNNLIVNLGGAEREFASAASQDNPANIGWVQLYAKLTAGAVKYTGKGTFKVFGASDYEDGTYLSNTGYIYINNDVAFGSGQVKIDNDGTAWPRLHGDVSTSIANPWRLKGTFGFHAGNAVTWTGDITIPAPVIFMCESGSLTIRSEKMVDDEGKCAIGNFKKFGGKELKMYTPITVDNTVITMGDGIWRFYGKVSGDSFTLSGPTGNGFVYFDSENDFSGKICVLGTSSRSISVCFNAQGSLPSGVTSILLGERGFLQSSSSYSCEALINRNVIDTASVGGLCIGVNDGEPDTTVDLSAYPDMCFGASGGNRTFKGVLVAGPKGYRIGGGPNYLTLAGANALTGDHDVYILGQTYIGNACDVAGTVYIANEVTLILQTVSDAELGQMPNCNFVVGRYATLFFNADRGSEIVRACSVELRGGYLQVQGNNKAETNQKITGNVIVSEVLGGYSMIRMKTNNKYDTILTCNTIDLSGPAVVGIEGFNLGGAPGANSCHIKATSRPTLVGGNGLAGSTTISIVPQMIGGTTENGAEAGGYVQSFVTYDDTVGYRPLDLTTEYVQGLPTDGTQHNVRLLATETRELAGSLTVNALLLQSVDAASGLVDTLKLAENAPEGTKLTITSGQIISGQRRQNTTIISAPIDFGSAHGMIAYGSYNYSDFRSSVSGDNGLTLVQSIPKPSNSRYVNFRTPSTFSGDVYVLNDVGFEDGFLPNGNERSGVLHLSYLTNCVHPTMSANALDGDGKIMANNSGGAYLTVGASGEEGDYQGLIDGKYGIIKLGSGRQRLAGNCLHYQSTTVSEGTLQVDGAFTKSAVTVASDATLAGCGTFGSAVTLADGAKLEVGSAKLGESDAEMNFEGGIEFLGDSAVTFKVLGKTAVAKLVVAPKIEVGGKLTISLDSKDLKGGEYCLFESGSELNIADYLRGANCGPLFLREGGKQLWMRKNTSLIITLR